RSQASSWSASSRPTPGARSRWIRKSSRTRAGSPARTSPGSRRATASRASSSTTTGADAGSGGAMTEQGSSVPRAEPAGANVQPRPRRAGRGLGPRDYYLLQVRGRTSGRLFSTPVNVIELQGTRFLVAPRGRTQWVRNAEVAGEVTLKRGGAVRRFRLRPIPDIGKPSVLHAYLQRFKTTVQRYFPVPAGSPLDAFTAIAPRYPVFELLPLDD